MSTKPSPWDHHDNMITNLRDWVNREVSQLHVDISKHAPQLDEDPHTIEMYRQIDSARDTLFGLIRRITEQAEAFSKKNRD